MLNRVNDISYLGCNEEKILNSNPTFNKDRLEFLYEFITQRQEIYKRREAGVSLEHLYDDLQDLFKIYKFTNVRREDDKTSKWLINNISNSDKFSVSEKFWRSFLFRLYNRIDTAEELEILDDNLWDRSDDKNIELISNINHDVYTRAFKTIGLRLQMNKLIEEFPRLGPLVFVRNLRESWLKEVGTSLSEEYPVIDKDNFSPSLRADSLFYWFLQFKGIGNFLAYQLFVDITYIEECPVSENEFVIAGPGCVRGLIELVDDWSDLSCEEMLFYLRDNLEDIFKSQIDKNFSCDKLFDNISNKYDRKFNVMSLENIFCEFKKYLYVRVYGSRTKKYYPGKF